MKRPWKNLAAKWKYLTAQEAMRRTPVLTMSRLLSWRTRCLLRRGAIARLPKWDVQMYLPANWRGIEKLIFAFREHYEPELRCLEQVLSPGMTVIDAGACYGIYTLAAGKMVGAKGLVLSFEPASRVFYVLQKNIALNSLTNVLAYPIALTETQGKAQLYHHPNVGCDSLGRDDSFTDCAEEVATESLDDVLRKIHVYHVDIIKMDVQGAEELVLRGARTILNLKRPIVIFEIYPEGTVSLGLTPYGAWELLENLGYEFFVIDGRGALHRKQSPPVGGNVVAIHKHSATASKSTSFVQSKTTGGFPACIAQP